jgi:putative transposase
VAVIDWYSPYVLNWDLSITLDAEFCVATLDRAFSVTRPEIFNTDQGSQYTSAVFISWLKEANVRISMDGKGRSLDTIMIERLWRTVTYEEVYFKDCASLQLPSTIGRVFTILQPRTPHNSNTRVHLNQPRFLS